MSTRPVAPDQLSDGWERINPIAIRMPVRGGWVYDITNSGPVFVPSVDSESVPAASGAVDDSGVGGPIVE
jgi:hypothetical protein